MTPLQHHQCVRAGVDAGEVADLMDKSGWCFENCLARVRNREEQAARRAAHDTGYERRDWVGYF